MVGGIWRRGANRFIVPRHRAVVAVLVATLIGWPPLARPADADPLPADGADAVVACRQSVGAVPEAGPRACRGLESVTWNLADACRTAAVPTVSCSDVDGRSVGEAEIAAYESSWVHRALAAQRRLDDVAPLLRSLWPHTHNTFNAFAYGMSLTGLDSNQVYSIRDQLRMDIRAIEMDVHWVPSIYGSAATGGKAVVLCHGDTRDTPAGVVHVGCSNDRPLAPGLAELRGWLEEPANVDEVVMLYLQNELDGDPAGHAAATTVIEEELGGLVFRPPTGAPCGPLPLHASRAGVRASGARVILVGNCGPGAWGTWVHERVPRWHESNSPMGDDYAPSGCDAERAAYGYDTNWIRRYEDSTAVSFWAGTGGQVTPAETARMVACGVQMVGFDQLVPSDPRLEALVWSWAPDEPAAPGCALSRSGDHRLVSGDCGAALRAVCRTASGHWAVTAAAVTWSGAAGACAAEFVGGAFVPPATGYELAQIGAAKAGADAMTAWVDATA